MGSATQLVRKNWSESRSTLAVSVPTLFILAWLFVFLAVRIEAQLRESPFGNEILQRIMQSQGLDDVQFSRMGYTMSFWTHPIVLLIMGLWAISRGSLAVSGELERGTLDLQLTRPVSRGLYLFSHIVLVLSGLIVLAAAQVGGYMLGAHLNRIEDAPNLITLMRPASNFAALGFALFGITLAVSAMSNVRRLPIMVASCFSIGSFIVFAIVNIRGMEEWRWLDQFSIFHTYRPANTVVKGLEYGRDISILLGISMASIVIAYLAFRRRDLPSNT